LATGVGEALGRLAFALGDVIGMAGTDFDFELRFALESKIESEDNDASTWWVFFKLEARSEELASDGGGSISDEVRHETSVRSNTLLDEDDNNDTEDGKSFA